MSSSPLAIAHAKPCVANFKIETLIACALDITTEKRFTCHHFVVKFLGSLSILENYTELLSGQKLPTHFMKENAWNCGSYSQLMQTTLDFSLQNF